MLINTPRESASVRTHTNSCVLLTMLDAGFTLYFTRDFGKKKLRVWAAWS
jgi:hypothetical protein